MTEPFLLTAGDPGRPPLLCLHGIGSCANAFVPQFPLADRCDRYVAAWDAPGYRRSGDVEAPFTLDDWADAAAHVLRSLGASPTAPADVLGVSWGGVTATRLVLRHPELVRSLVLASSSVGSGTTAERADAMRGRADELAAVGHDAFCRSRAPRLVTPNAPAQLVDDVAETMIASVRPDGYALACHSMADTDHTGRLGDIAAPTLVLVGDEDIVTPLERAQVLADGIPGAELRTIASAGHLANQEEPEAFNELVAAFLLG